MKQRFFNSPPGTDKLFLLTHAVARLMTLQRRDSAAGGKFAAQLQVNLLCDVALVIESAIKAKNPEGRYFSDLGTYLLKEATQSFEKEKTPFKQFETDFDSALNRALDGTLTLDQRQLTRLQCDVALAVGLRNHGAHEASSTVAVSARFPEVQAALFRTLFATIDYLYR